jgi:cyclase
LRCAVVAASLALSVTASAAAPYAARRGFDVQQLADGVYALIRNEPVGFYRQPNVVFIINDADVVVVDALLTASATRDAVAALRKLTTKPVRYVINTHGHDDHVTGNHVYADSFPGVVFIAHPRMADTMRSNGATKRASFLQSIPPTIGFFRQLLTTGKGMAGEALTSEEAAAYANDTTLMSGYVSEASGFRRVVPTMMVDDRIVLRQGRRTIEVIAPGRAHTDGDLIVHLPAERIVIAGDLVVSPVPLFGTTAFPLEYGAALQRLLDVRPSIIVPGHGAVQRNDEYVRLMQQLLAAIGEQVRSAVARGETLEQTRRSVDVTQLRDRFTGSSQLLRDIFANYVTSPAVARAYEAASSTR